MRCVLADSDSAASNESFWSLLLQSIESLNVGEPGRLEVADDDDDAAAAAVPICLPVERLRGLRELFETSNCHIVWETVLVHH